MIKMGEIYLVHNQREYDMFHFSSKSVNIQHNVTLELNEFKSSCYNNNNFDLYSFNEIQNYSTSRRIIIAKFLYIKNQTKTKKCLKS